MTEAIYKVGDILEIPGNVVLPRQFGMFPKEETCRCLVLNVLYPGFDSISYTLLTHKDGFGTFNIVGVGHANIADCAKLIGHSDISALRYEKPEEAENAMLKSQIACMEGRIESLIQKRNQLDADNRYLSAKVEHLIINNDRKNGKIGSLQAELHEKAKELDRVYHSDIVCENNKLRNENKILNEIVNDFKSTCDNCEARSENEVLKRENEELRGYNKELEQALSKSKEENGKLAQKISCADNLLAEAANRLYQGRAHLNISAHN